MSFTQVNLFSQFPNGGIVSSVGLGIGTGDPAAAMFTAANFPGASSAQLTRARNLYAVLTGRITSVSGTAVLDETTNGYTNLGQYVERDRQREMGYFAQDSWRIRPNLTVNGGLRWEVQFPFVPLNNDYAQTTVDQLYGISGFGNLFKPGTLTGTQTEFTGFAAGDP